MDDDTKNLLKRLAVKAAGINYLAAFFIRAGAISKQDWDDVLQLEMTYLVSRPEEEVLEELARHPEDVDEPEDFGDF